MMIQKIREYFKLEERGSNFITEFRAGTGTFLTMCYLISVNARILSESGGPCECSAATAEDFACRFYDEQYLTCVEDFRRELITVTCLSSFIACCMMGVGANLPFALAPGMGLNAYFTYDVVGFHGTGNVAWKTAMAAVFIEGIIFLALTLTGLRMAFARAIPETIKTATTGGIGFFLAHLGLQSAEGIGLVVTDIATGVTLGGCPPANRTYAEYDGLTADAYTCDNAPGSKMTSETTWLGICCIFLIGFLLKRRVSGAIILGVMFATFLSWFKNTKISYFEDDVYPLGGGAGMSGGDYRYNYFKKVVSVEPLKMSAGQMDFNWDGGSLVVALFTFLYVDLLDTTGTVFAMAKFAGLMDENGSFPGETQALCVDSMATSIGACLGTSPVTTYIESATGIEEGGRTGLTAIVVGCWFFMALFFAPLLSSVPPWATGPALIVVGAMMMKNLVNIDWANYGEAIPAFITIALMPLTYSIAYGIIGGLFCYAVINGLDWLVNQIPGMKLEEPEPAAPKATEVEQVPQQIQTKPLEAVSVFVSPNLELTPVPRGSLHAIFDQPEGPAVAQPQPVIQPYTTMSDASLA